MTSLKRMSFFKKLRQRLGGSASKIQTGIDDLIREGAPSSEEDASPPPQDEIETPPSPPAEKPKTPLRAGGAGGIVSRIRTRVARKEPLVVFDDEMLEKLEDLLIASDMGVNVAARVAANIAADHLGRSVSASMITSIVQEEIARIMEAVATPLPLYPEKPQVVLVVGVNGAGKTTTIGKLASQFRAAGKKVMIAAGDTFRAAAVEQLQIWGARADVPVFAAKPGGDPASLAFDALTQAQNEVYDLLLIDTAGRLQNREDLMSELEKIMRVLRKKCPDAPHNTLLILDATTGQNAIDQVAVFREIADVSGLIMTKLDGTAKGGILVALADKFQLPIHAIGIGEQIDDLSAFDPKEFAEALLGQGELVE